MSKKKNIKKSPPAKNAQVKKTRAQKQQDSVFTEAWENMSEDMGKIMPDFLTKRLQDRKGKVWVLVAITFVELVVLGVVGKFIYDWFVTP